MLVNLENYVLAWFPLVVLALVVGLVRDRTFGKRLDEGPARRLATGLAALFFGAYIAVVAAVMPFQAPAQALLVGGIWIAITLVFDGLMRLVSPKPERPADDDLFSGPRRSSGAVSGALLLLWMGLAPWLFDHLFWRV